LQNIFDLFRGLGLGIEIHAGEFAGPASVWDALQYGAPDRLGHAVAAFEDEALVQTLLERRIHIEFCPTSNLRLGVVRQIEQHPLGVARELGLEFSINTDDPGPFECSLTSEFELVQRTFGFTAGDFERVFQSALRAAFADSPATVPPASADGPH
jgi:adenosine deaminase